MIQQARIDICPFFRAEVWAVLLGVKVSNRISSACVFVYVHTHVCALCVFVCLCVLLG